MTAIFLSDVHLREPHGIKSQLVVRFLQEVASRFEKIYILGDLFDVWPGTTDYLIESFRPVLEALRQLVKDGHRIRYLEGNHDFRLGEYFSSELGIEISPEFHVEKLGDKLVYMAHGDLGNPKQLGYRLLRRALRSELLHATMKLVPADFIYKVGLNSSKLSRNYQTKFVDRDAETRSIYRENAERLFEKGFDVVLMGHTHIPDHHTKEISGRVCHYFNTGDWVRNFTYLEFDGSEFYTKKHPIATT